MRHRPTEVKKVTELLEKEWEDTAELAVSILDMLVEEKWSRGGWVMAVRDAAYPLPMLYGPYPTRNQAEKDVGRRIMAATHGARGRAFKVINLDAKEEPKGLF